MTKSVFQSRWITTNTWLINGDGCASYLVVGDDCGVVIDTGFSTENIKQFVQTLTEKPVIYAANTHGHFDHTGGNGWFERTYMSAKALEIAKIPYPSKEHLKYPLDYMVTIVGDGDKIELGNRTLEVLEIPAHAPSSIAFLDRKERILFIGDEVEVMVALVWMQDEPQPSIEQHARNMEKVLKYQKEFDHICTGHSLVMQDPSLIMDYLENDHRILSGIEGEPFVPLPNAPADFHMPRPEFKRISKYKNTKICYDIRYVHDKK